MNVNDLINGFIELATITYKIYLNVEYDDNKHWFALDEQRLKTMNQYKFINVDKNNIIFGRPGFDEILLASNNYKYTASIPMDYIFRKSNEEIDPNNVNVQIHLMPVTICSVS